MKTSDFNYELPSELIAQTPIENRDHSRLMVLNKKTKRLSHQHFYDIIDLLDKDDVLVMNNTRVIPARLFGIKKETGAKVEVLILKQEGFLIEALVGNAKVIKNGTEIVFKENVLSAVCVEKKEDGICLFEFKYEGILLEKLEEIGQMPLPPYIHERLEDANRYQTIYAKINGSSAAPTAGLHFNETVLSALRAKGVQILEITLHVGLATFRSVKVDDISNHKMHFEEYHVNAQVASKLNEAKQANRRIISVGTTTTRVLETQMKRYHEFKEETSQTDLFITPGFRFQAIDALITNFHLPQSTLLMLVSAFSERELILQAYQEAVREKYRFFSFGDAMIIYG